MARTARTLPVLALALAIAATGCASPPPRADPPPMPDPAASAIRMAAVGDSITDGDSIDLAGGTPGPLSWVSYAVGPEVEFIGGWAEWGASVEHMADSVQGPYDADVLVILAGTNDASWTPHREIGTHLIRIAENAEVSTVVLSSVPPNDFAEESTRELNSFLETVADRQGWTWVDAATGLREGGRYAEGMSEDGVHPTEAGARELGEAIGPAVIEAVSGG